MQTKHTTNVSNEKPKLIYGGKYDYIKVNYKKLRNHDDNSSKQKVNLHVETTLCQRN